MPKTPNGSDAHLNKSEWIRSQPTTMSAKEVVSKAKAAGIALSVAQVYTTRSLANRRAGAANRRARGSNGARRAELPVAGDTEATFRRLVLKLGTDRVEAMLAQFKQGAGL